MSVIREAQMIIGILEDGQLAHDFSAELQSALAELKEHAGRLLDGATHDAFPEARP